MRQAGETDDGHDTDFLLISKSGLIETIRTALLEHFSDECDLSLSEREAQSIALDIVWRGMSHPKPQDILPANQS